ncbi:hypothetical protein [Cohnella mopanensis]|uniref:hypothetical protein n=1 Tax=Cohnella mopanensis TaxID=2911966 RepID=UPI001EF967BD|nr:hypothetical protein [Cohnella mopanensis]
MRKRMKQLSITVLTLVMSLFGATSAFAYDGWADSIPTAYSLNGPISGVSTTINGSDDVDWFSWTNDTGKSVNFVASLQSPAGKNYDLHAVTYTGSSYLSNGAATDHGAGAIDSMGGNLPAGWTMYFQVRGQTGSDYSTSLTYNINFSYS